VFFFGDVEKKVYFCILFVFNYEDEEDFFHRDTLAVVRFRRAGSGAGFGECARL
jgi:hypothetical protein